MTWQSFVEIVKLAVPCLLGAWIGFREWKIRDLQAKLSSTEGALNDVKIEYQVHALSASDLADKLSEVLERRDAELKSKDRK